MDPEQGRYIILGTIDGVLATLGIVLGVFSASQEPRIILSAGLGGALALTMTNGLGSYLAEGTVEYGRLSQIEEAMLTSLKNTQIKREKRKKIALDSLTHGGCSFLGSLVPLAPFLLGLRLSTPLLSVALSIGVLIFLGAFSGHISKQNLLVSIVKMVGLGLAVALAATLLGLH